MKWERGLFKHATEKSLREWLDVAKLSAGSVGCTADLIEAQRIFDKSICFEWRKGKHKFLVVFMNKEHTNMAAWRLEVYYDPVDEEEVVPLVVATIKDFNKSIYFIKTDMPRNQLLMKVYEALPEIKII